MSGEERGGEAKEGKHDGGDDRVDAVGLTAGLVPRSRAGVVAAPPRRQKRLRDKTVERAAEDILSMTTKRFRDEDGVLDVGRMNETLRRALAQSDPVYAATLEAKAILDVLKKGMGAQTRDADSSGVKKALRDALSVGVAEGLVSARQAGEGLGLGRKGLGKLSSC